MGFVTMSEVTPLMDGARKIVLECARVESSENVLIITDTGRDLAVAYAFMQAVSEVGAEPVVVTMKQRSSPGEEPPPHVKEAMLHSDVILQATTTIMAYTDAKKEACAAGARFAAMTGMLPEIVKSPAVCKTNFAQLTPLIKALGTMVEAAKNAKITTPKGTHLEMSLTGRNAFLCTSILDAPGCMSGVPDLEVFIGPVEDSVNGVAVIDGTISSYGLVENDVTLTIEQGILKKIEGKKEADHLKETLESQNNPNVYQVAELGIGLNPHAELRGAIIEDEGALGTVHIAVGDNILMGGTNKAPVHIDMVMKEPVIELDGKPVIKVEKNTIYVAPDIFPMTACIESWNMKSL